MDAYAAEVDVGEGCLGEGDLAEGRPSQDDLVDAEVREVLLGEVGHGRAQLGPEEDVLWPDHRSGFTNAAGIPST